MFEGNLEELEASTSLPSDEGYEGKQAATKDGNGAKANACNLDGDGPTDNQTPLAKEGDVEESLNPSGHDICRGYVGHH